MMAAWNLSVQKQYTSGGGGGRGGTVMPKDLCLHALLVRLHSVIQDGALGGPALV